MGGQKSFNHRSHDTLDLITGNNSEDGVKQIWELDVNLRDVISRNNRKEQGMGPAGLQPWTECVKCPPTVLKLCDDPMIRICNPSQEITIVSQEEAIVWLEMMECVMNTNKLGRIGPMDQLVLFQMLSKYIFHIDKCVSGFVQQMWNRIICALHKSFSKFCFSENFPN